jgi:hypothetical protein
MPRLSTNVWILGIAAGAGVVVAAGLSGCRNETENTTRNLRFRGDNADVYLNSVAATLNDLPNSLDLDLLPAQPILTAATSANGEEVRALCIQNPQTKDGPYTFLQAVDGNALFHTLGVKRGDIVRYYVNYDEDAAEQNIELRKALELTVRRLDVTDPENALILDQGLSGPVLTPERIEIWRYSDKRMNAVRSMIDAYVNLRKPAAGWEPSPDLAALRLVVERANEWLRNLPPAGEDDQWRLDPLIEQLPAELRDSDAVAKAIAQKNLRDGLFDDAEGRLLEEAVWCRDISQWVRSDITGDLDAAVALFDWTVRNIQLDPPVGEGDDPHERAAVTIHHPWQALVYGHGTAEHRAWVFAEFCRQQAIDVVLLRPGQGDGDAKSPLLAAALIEDQLYLFDPALGLPLPGPDGAADVGTLAELAANDDLLRQFDVGDTLTYPLTANQLDDAMALVVASPLQLSRRTALLEARIEGEDFVELATDAAALAERVAKLPHIGGVQLWEQPFQARHDEATMPNVPNEEKRQWRDLAAAEFAPFAERPLLWKARVLHFQGNKGIRAAERSDPLAEAREGHADAAVLYQDPTVRPPDARLAKLAEAKRTVYEAAKSAASYWLGLLCYSRGDYEVAAQWLGERSLEREPQGKWASGARYNLARTYEMQERSADAIKLLEATPEGDPQREGNLVRAKLLAEQSDK